MSEPIADPIVGIDLGTTNSVVAVARADNTIDVLSDSNGYKVQPSVVSFHPNGSVVVGAEAKQRRIIDAANTIYSAKRLIGRTFDSPEVTAAAARLPYGIKQGKNQQPVLDTRAGLVTIPEISAIILDHLRNIAADRLDTKVERAVITVPANFTDAQRAATATAGAIAGLVVPRVLNEPTAAALAYGHTRALSEIIAVYDFGGGTFDVSILKLSGSVYEVLSTAGNSFLGGDDIDERVVATMTTMFLQNERIDLRGDDMAMQRLRQVAEQIKVELSRRTRAIVSIDEIAYGPGGKAINLNLEMTRQELVQHAAKVVDQTFPVCQEALTAAGLKPTDIADVVLVGGSTKMPYVRERVAGFFGKQPRTDINPDEAVAMGAALQGMALQQILGAGPAAPKPKSARSEAATSRPDVAPIVPPRARQPTEPQPFVADQPPVAPADRLDTASRTGDWAIGFDAAEPDEPTAMVPAESFRPSAPSAPSDLAGRSDTAVFFADIELPEATDILKLGAPITPEQTREIDLGDALPADRAPVTSELDLAETLPRGEPVATSGLLESDLFEAIPRAEQAPAESGDQPTFEKSIEFDLGAMGLAGDDEAGFDDQETNTAIRMPDEPADLALQAPASLTGSTENSIELDLGSLGLPPPSSQSSPSSHEVPASPIAAEPAAAPQAAPAAAPQGAPQVPIVLDVIPHSLGVGTVAGYCEELISRNSRVPTQTKRVFATSKNDQRTVRILVCQGESRRLDENVVLGDVVLDGIEPRPRGETAIEVTFYVDASGILHVRAVDNKTGVEKEAYLNIHGAPSTAEVSQAAMRFQAIRS